MPSQEGIDVSICHLKEIRFIELAVATPLRIFEIGQVAEASSYVWIDKDRKNACIYLATEKHIKSLK